MCQIFEWDFKKSPVIAKKGKSLPYFDKYQANVNKFKQT